MDFVAIDFETANGKRNSACSVAVVEVKNGEIYDSFYALIHPPTLEFNAINMQIHGITPADVLDKPTFPVIWGELKARLENKLVLAHNASFDMSVLRNSISEYNLTPPRFKHCCTVSIAKKTWPELENHKLGTLGNYFKIDFQHHNALDDARTCAAIALLAGKVSATADIYLLTRQLGVAIKDFSL